MKSSPDLICFYTEYLAWVDAGAPEDSPFTRAAGLCHNIYEFAEVNEGMRPGFLCDEMHRQFRLELLSETLPFQSPEDYTRETEGDMCHMNARRLQWVRDRIAEAS